MNIKRVCQFVFNKEKGKPDAKLRYRMKWNNNKNIVSKNIGYRVDIDKWSTETQRCKTNTTHGKKKVSARIINNEIQRFEQLADEVFTFFEKENKVPTTAEFTAEFDKRNGKTPLIESDKLFFDTFDEFTKTMGLQNSWQQTTYRRLNVVKGHLMSFDENLSFENLSDETLQEFIRFQINEHKQNSTIAKNISLVKWFLRWAATKGYYSGNLHTHFKPKLKGLDGNSKEIIHLTWDELLHLHNLKLPREKAYLAKVRDVFCFCCFTSLRYSDVAKLRRSDIGDNHISVITQKTADGLKIELNDYSREILDRYKDEEFPDDKALPVISNQRMNDYLKELGEIAGIDTPQRVVYFIGNERREMVYKKYELLTTHCGRRTFIVNALFLGIPAEVVMKWTGHSDYASMKPYIKIVDDLKAKEMNKFNKKKPRRKKTKKVPDTGKRELK